MIARVCRALGLKLTAQIQPAGYVKTEVTKRGEPVAELVPAGTSGRRAGNMAAARMQTLSHEAPPLESVDVKALIKAGRD